MYPVIQSFLAGFPVLILHTSVTVAMLVAAIFIYIKITPYDDLKLIRGGNTAAAVSLSGAIIGPRPHPRHVCLSPSFGHSGRGLECLKVTHSVFRFAIRRQ